MRNNAICTETEFQALFFNMVFIPIRVKRNIFLFRQRIIFARTVNLPIAVIFTGSVFIFSFCPAEEGIICSCAIPTWQLEGFTDTQPDRGRERSGTAVHIEGNGIFRSFPFSSQCRVFIRHSISTVFQIGHIAVIPVVKFSVITFCQCDFYLTQRIFRSRNKPQGGRFNNSIVFPFKADNSIFRFKSDGNRMLPDRIQSLVLRRRCHFNCLSAHLSFTGILSFRPAKEKIVLAAFGNGRESDRALCFS